MNLSNSIESLLKNVRYYRDVDISARYWFCLIGCPYCNLYSSIQSCIFYLPKYLALVIMIPVWLCFFAWYLPLVAHLRIYSLYVCQIGNMICRLPICIDILLAIVMHGPTIDTCSSYHIEQYNIVAL